MTLKNEIEDLKETLVKLAKTLIQAIVCFWGGVGLAITAGSTGRAMWVAGITSALPYVIGQMQRTGEVKLTLDGYRGHRKAQDRLGDAGKPGAKT
jgi:hypothetical protein